MPSFVLGRDKYNHLILYKTPAVGFTVTSSDIDKKYLIENDEELVCSNVLGVTSWTLVSEPDLIHRINGPALEYPDGTKHWFYYGERIKCSSQEEFVKLLNLKAFW